MEKNSRGNGKIIKNMELVFLLGPMEDLMKVTIAMIKNMVMGRIHGLMVGSTLVNGRTINAMEGELM